MANALNKVNSGGIKDDSIVNADIKSDAAIAGSKLADNAVGLAQMASGTDGQIITYDASGDPIAVGPGTDGQVLTSTGAGSPPAFETPAPGVGGATGVDFNDNVKSRWGTGNDLEIYHDASNSYIKDTGTGSLKLTSDQFIVLNAANDEYMIIGDQNDSVKLYHDGTKKVETTSTGATVTGNVKSGGVTLQTQWDSDVTYATSRSGGAGYGDTNLGPVSITPKYSTSKMQVQAGIQYKLNDGGSNSNWGGLAVFRSNDGGSNWSQVTFGPRDSNGVFLLGTNSAHTIRGYFQINFNTDASQTTEVQFKLMMNKYQDGSIVVNETSNDVQRCWMSVREYTD
tara:strand:- start:929 stop:1948 length:1020 start_codon:yes stop_codon:yes gene_type:complete